MSREYSTNPRFEDNGDIGSCDNSSYVTNNKVTAIYSDDVVGMLTDPSAFASSEARNLKGRNIESSTNPLSGQSQSNSVEVSGLACSTCKPNDKEYCLPDARSNALNNSEDKSLRPSSASMPSCDLAFDNLLNKEEQSTPNPSHPVPNDSHCPPEGDTKYDEKYNDSLMNKNCLVSGSTNASTPLSPSPQSPLSSLMLPICTGLQTFDAEKAFTGSASSIAQNTSHDLEKQKKLGSHVPAMSSMQPVNENATYVVKSASPSKIVDDKGCVLSLTLSSGNEDQQHITITNANATNDDNETCIENAATTVINRNVCGPIDNDDVACHASHKKSTSTRALAAKTRNLMTTANLSENTNKQFNPNDDITSVMTATSSSTDISGTLSKITHQPSQGISQIEDEQNKAIEANTCDQLEKANGEVIKDVELKDSNHQRDVGKSLPTVINSSKIASPTNQYFNDTNTDAFSAMKNLNDTTTATDVAISASADKSSDAAATVALKIPLSQNDVDLNKVNGRNTGVNSPSAISTNVAAFCGGLHDGLQSSDNIKTGDQNNTFNDVIIGTDTASRLIEKSNKSKGYRSNASSEKGSSNDSSVSGGKNINGAPASPATLNIQNKLVATTALVPAISDVNDSICINASFNGAKHSLSKDLKIRQTVAKSGMNNSVPRGAGWGTPVGLGLRGGGETSIATGGSGWGPPPPSSNPSAARGWGNPQPPNPPTGNGSSAWGASNSTAPISTDDPNGSNNIAKNAGPIPLSVNSVSASQAPGGPIQQNNAPPPSWAAAAGKGLPNNDNASNSVSGAGAGVSQNTTSKQLESLQSVKEALFSQDGWGGDNVKQDNAWDVGGGGGNSWNGASTTGQSETSQAAAKKEPPSSNPSTAERKNDGTDLWKCTLSGQPPAPKPQQRDNAWSHTPQNPTDYKNWGEDDDSAGHRDSGGAGGGSTGPIGSQGNGSQGTGPIGPMGGANAFGGSIGSSIGAPGTAPARNDPFSNDGPYGPQYGAPLKPKDDWNPSTAGNSGWNDTRREGAGGPVGANRSNINDGNRMNHVTNETQGNSWAAQGPRPAGSGPTGTQWNSGVPPPPRGTSGWDHDSPPMGRRLDRLDGSNQINDGTSYWGRGGESKPPGPPGAPPTLGGVSGWKDMPTPNNMQGGIRGPPGPPGPRMPPGKDPWGQPHPTRPYGETAGPDATGGTAPIGHNPSGGSGMVGWADPDSLKRDPVSTGGFGDSQRGPSQWNNGPRNPNPAIPRGSPDWEGPVGPNMDLPGPGASSGGWNNPIKPVGPKKITPEMIWTSKQFRMLCDMGCSKTDAEAALKNTNLNLEDALEMLNAHNRLPVGRSEPPAGPFGGSSGNDFPNIYNKGPNRFTGPNLGPSGQGNYGSSQENMIGGGNNHPNMQGNQNIPGNFNPMKMMQPNGMNPPPGPNNPGMNLAPGGPQVGASTGQGVRPQASGAGGANNQPSAQQLKLLVQQIQMAVQAGHLNPQILNQPLAPQTLVLLNQLLQQIKNLANHQNILSQQKSMGNNSNLLSVSVDITKTKQEIQNLQNQISAQQATYLKQQTMPPMPPQSGTGSLQGPEPRGVANLFEQMTMASSGNLGTTNPTDTSGSGSGFGGSKLNNWINKPNDSFAKAPGPIGASTNTSKSSSNLWTGADDTWGAPSPNAPSSSTGWPDTTGPSTKSNAGQGQGGQTLQQLGSNAAANQGSNTTNGIPENVDFGIPEFQPGKPWKGPGMKDPSEDPNLTPGSVNMAPLELNALSKTSSSISLAASSSTTTTLAASTAAGMDNTFGLNSTWSFGTHKSDGITTSGTASNSISKPVDSTGAVGTWGANGPITSIPAGGSNLTPMGQDLWGKSAIGRTPPGLAGAPGNTSSWPSSNGWSAGHNGTNDGANQPAWLLLKNLTPQIDGSTLKTLCMQHGPLKNFQLFLNQGLALVQYAASREALKAQKTLNNCPLGNTTIQAIAISDQDAITFLSNVGERTQTQQTLTPTRGSTPSNSGMTSSSSTLVGSSHGLPKTSSAGDMWGTNISVANSLFGSTSTTTGSSSSAVWSMHGASDLLDQQRTTPNLQPFLPNDLLGENNM